MGLLEEVLLIEGAGTQVLGVPDVATQPEAGGRVGEVPVAVSWVWQPGPPCGGAFLGSGVGLLPPFSGFSGFSPRSGVLFFWIFSNLGIQGPPSKMSGT